MKSMRIIGIIILVVGFIMIGASQYINTQVLQGRAEIASGEEKVKQGKTLFGLNPVSKEIGDTVLIRPAEQKIAAGKMQADEYARLANNLRMGGIVAIIVGAGVFLYSFKKK